MSRQSFNLKHMLFILFLFRVRQQEKGKTQVSTILLTWIDPRYFCLQGMKAQISMQMLTIFWHQIRTWKLATYISYQSMPRRNYAEFLLC